MTDDIVARLRLTPVLIRADEMGQSRIDYEACKKFVNQEGVKLMREAADEIERLRAERDEARREICIRSAGFIRADRWMKTPKKVAHWSEEDVALSRGWDCFNEVKP